MLIVRSVSIFYFNSNGMRYIILLFIFFINNKLSSQNLLSNGSFEELVNLEPYSDKTVKDWEFYGICYNCNNNNTNFYNMNMGKDRRCDPKYYKYLDGKTKIWLNGYIFKLGTNSISGFIYTKLKQKLKVGKIYKVEVNMYFPSVQLVDTAFYRQVGFNVLLEKPVVPESFKNWKFVNDTITYDQWVKRNWYFRATCELEYFVIGVTLTDDWALKDSNKYFSSEFYIDDVALIEVDEKQIESKNIEVTSFCKCKEIQKRKVIINELSLYYDSNQYELNENAKFRLDSLSLYLKKFPNSVFEVSGYTDDIGNNHEFLSKKRVEAVINYLIEKQGINKYRLLPNYFGNIGKGKNEDERQKNRRVDLKLSNYRIEQILYSKALNTNSNDSTFSFLKLWLLKVNSKEKIFALFDTRLDNRRKDKKWILFVENIKKGYQQLKKPKDAFLLDSLYCEDQKYRTLEYKINGLGMLDNSLNYKTFEFPKISNVDWVRLDSINYKYMSQYIDKNGWPNESEVGERPSKSAFYIIDHFIDTNSFKKYLPILKSKCNIGEADWSDYATLFDRNEKESGRMQQYCTQFTQDESIKNKYVLAPYDNEKAVNERRKLIGLDPIRDFKVSFTMKTTHLKE